MPCFQIYRDPVDYKSHHPLQRVHRMHVGHPSAASMANITTPIPPPKYRPTSRPPTERSLRPPAPQPRPHARAPTSAPPGQFPCQTQNSKVARMSQGKTRINGVSRSFQCSAAPAVHCAIVIGASAGVGGAPESSSARNAMKLSPPATVFGAPPGAPAKNRKRIDSGVKQLAVSETESHRHFRSRPEEHNPRNLDKRLPKITSVTAESNPRQG
jgi:hypothetical protein